MINTVSRAALPVAENLVVQKNRIENNSGTGSKRVCIVTGIHGDELEGQYVCARLSKLLDDEKQKLSGIVDIYPAVNPLGIDSIIRGFPTFNMDMNRIFPGSSSGSLAEAVALDIIHDIEGSDLCIDIHSSNIFLREIPQVRISDQNEKELLPYACMLNTNLVWIHAAATVLDSTLAHTLNSRGVKTLVVEMGVGMRITGAYCEQLLAGVLNLLNKLDMWCGEVEDVIKPIISKDRNVGFINSDVAGIFVPKASLGSYVTANEVVGSVFDPLTGSTVECVLSPCNGLLFTLREYPVVFGGSLLARIMGDHTND